MKRVFGFVVFLGAIGWIWTGRTGYFAPKLEATSLSCSAPTPAAIVTIGTVRNISEEPLRLTARVAILSASRPQWSEGSVQPSPLPPGQTGSFSVTTQTGAAYYSTQVECTLDWFKDEDGRRLKYIDTEAAGR